MVQSYFPLQYSQLRVIFMIVAMLSVVVQCYFATGDDTEVKPSLHHPEVAGSSPVHTADTGKGKNGAERASFFVYVLLEFLEKKTFLVPLHFPK